MKKCSLILGLILSACAVIGTGIKIDRHYAKAYELEATAADLTTEIAMVDAGQKAFFYSIAAKDVRARIWELEKKHGEKPLDEWDDPDDVQEYKELKEEYEDLKEKQEDVKKQVDETT